MKRLILLAALCAITAERVGAYERQSHEELSSLSLSHSALKRDGTILAAFGLKELSSKEAFPSTTDERLTVDELVRTGANAQDDGLRPINHFYDPYYARALTLPLSVPLAFASPDWALEDKRPISSGEQIFSYRNALSYFQFALSAQAKQTRDQNWGRLFESLGHIIHHVQDMAQPQHVRDDDHLDYAVIGDRSLYEECTDAAIASPADLKGCGSPLSVPQYGSVAFPKARDFWTTLQSGDSYGRGRGLADFTNRNFVSKDTNFQLKDGRVVVNEDSYYPLPAPASSRTFTLEELGAPNAAETCERLKNNARSRGAAPNPECEIEFFSTDIYDAYTATSSINERASSLSIFDQYLNLRENLEGYKTDRLFTLNRFNYAAAHPFLISRAIGYSAGLIDHFFRGRMELEKAEVQGDQVRIEVKNVSAAGNSFGPGTFTMYYDAYNGTRKPLAIESGQQIIAGQLIPGGTHAFVVVPPDDLDLKADNPFALVYRGTVGVDDAVSGLVFDVADAYEGFLFSVNATDIGDRIQGPRLIYRKQGEWKLHPQGNLPVGGRVDWKGWYDNGKPTRMLTWAGTRYFYDNSVGPSIFEGGKVLAVAPYKVLGAALQRDPQGREWIIAICEGDGQDIVFKRPAKRSDSPELHHETLAPDGWQRISAFENPPDLSSFRRAWLFNGDGTQAQTMRERKRSYQAERRPLTRLKITTDGYSASLTDLGNSIVSRRDTSSNTVDCDGGEGTEQHQYLTSISGQHIVAVDYIDQEEVFARLAVESLRKEEASAVESIDPLSFSGTHRFSENSRWTLHVGAEPLTLLNKVSESPITYSASDGGGRESHRETLTGERVQLGALDLRSGLLVLQRAHLDRSLNLGRDLQDGLSAGSERAESHTQSYYEYSAKGDGIGTANYGRADVVDDNVSTERDLYPYFGLWDVISWNCNPDAKSASGASESEFAATMETLPALIVKGGFFRTSAAVNRKGDIFASMVIRDSVTNQHRFASLLSGADPVSVTGVTSEAPDPFWPIFNSIVPK